MARKKAQDGPSGGNAPWMNTFADLMNLLFCFFIMLFAMSNVDAAKFDQISASMTSSLSIFEGGGSAIDDGQLVSTGMTQLNNLDNYYSNMGEDEEGAGESDKGENTSDNPDNTDGEGDKTGSGKSNDEGENNSVNKGDNSSSGNGNTEGSNDSSGAEDKKDSGKEPSLSDAMEKVKAEEAKLTEEMYDAISEQADKDNLGDYMELSIDPDHQYVQLNLKGSILFESGKADIKEEAKPIFSKIGDLLEQYSGNYIEIEGHTDNVPMDSESAEFKDNNWLSSARALNAAEYLIDIKGLDPSMIKYSGRGEYEPVASNSTEDGRAKNRRIEIKIYNKLSGK